MELALDDFMVNLITKTQTTHYLGVFSPSKTFRNDLYPEYKANRKKQPPPAHIEYWKPRIIKLCVEKYQFFIADNIEADDVLSIMREAEGFDEIIFCSPDKDIRQIPGKHYNYGVKEDHPKVWEEIDIHEAAYRFWLQMLIGDSTDNVKGCKGIGEEKAPKIVRREMTIEEMKEAVRTAYLENKKYKDKEEAEEQMRLQSRLLRLIPPLPLDGVVEQVYGKHVIEVAYNDAELNIDTDESSDNGDRVLQDNQRPHQDDILRSAAGLPEQV